MYGGRVGSWLGLGGEELDVTTLFLAGLLGEELDEGGIAAGEGIEGGLEVLDGGEVEKALGAGTQLAAGLGAAQEEDAEDGDVAGVEVEVIEEVVPVFLDAVTGAEDDGDEFFLTQGGDACLDGGIVVGSDGVAVGGLVAGGDQSVEGEGVVLGGGALFFEETAEDAGFGLGEEHWGILGLVASRR